MVSYLEHDNLVDELNTLENYNPQERLDHAKRRRKDQLSNYIVRKKTEEKAQLTCCSHDKNIRFQPNITLIEASARNDAEEVNTLLTTLPGIMSPDLQNEDGLSALHQAVIEDCAEVVEVLVENGADLDIKDADLWTPLHAAVACGNYDLAKYLIDNGASLIEINTDGNMPIDLDNEENEDIEILLDESMLNAGYTEERLDEIRRVIPNEMLDDLRNSVDDGRNLNIIGEHGETACHVACANGYQEVLEFLLDNGARFDVGDTDDWQPIHAAACWGHDKVVELLVNHGADLEAQTKDGETPYDLTEDEEMQEMLIELKNCGKNVPKVRRSQSNSSRTLSVRRSSSIEKRQTSLTEGKQEGIARTRIDIQFDDDPNHEAIDGESQSDDSMLSTQSETGRESEDILVDEKESLVNVDVVNPNVDVVNPTEQKEVPIEINSHNDNISGLSKTTNDNCVVNIDPVEKKATFDNTEIVDEETAQKHSTSNKTKHNNTEGTRDHNDVELGVVECIPSHNTAAKNGSNQKFNDSNELTAKKKCCVIV